MTARRNDAGFSQRIRLEWLELTAQLVLQGLERDEIRAQLRDELQTVLSIGNDPLRGNREKAITILLRIWVSPPNELRPLRDDALAILRQQPMHEHLPIHWGMAMCTYPFFGTVAETVGRLVRVNGQVTPVQVQRQLRIQLGERETISRATRRVLRSMIDWRTLQDTEKKGVYIPVPPRPIADPHVRAWLIEAALRWSAAQAAPLRSLAETPAFFPFEIGPTTPNEVDRCSRMEWFRQGLDEDMVTLRSGRSSLR